MSGKKLTFEQQLSRLEEIVAALERAGATFEEESAPAVARMSLTKTDLMEAGLSGTPEAAARRQKLLAALELPATLSANRLLEALNATVTPEEWTALLAALS